MPLSEGLSQEKMMNMKLFINRIVVTVTMMVANIALAETQLTIGDVPPDYLGKDVRGNKVYVSGSKGILTVVTFWASWCPPCKKEIPVLDRIQSQLGKENINVVAVNLKESRTIFRRLVKLFKTSSVTLTHDKRGLIANDYGVSSIPHLFIIGKDGTLVYQARGYGEGSINKLVKVINKHLSD